MRYSLYWRRALIICLFGIFAGCSGIPPLAEQEQHIKNNEMPLHQLTPRAFAGVWGVPPYQRVEFMQFFIMKDGSFVPRSRVALGEAPKGWDAGVEAGEALFLVYPDRGWLLVFLDERLVYKEALTAAQLHTLGRDWKMEDRYRSRLESPASH
ncbi:conserved protein of unknown function [Nitrospira japonica]|uniref:Lipoprotein n=2 Tax=Nitrospira japonica TaxID=1325564 RepID=A0A1W1IB48_9BACT|nr:conserved protein of unknown function [Nitrospira japonica]